MKKYNYLYKIINMTNDKYYIGVRSCDCLPHNDLGYIYFGSSTDKQFKDQQEEYPEVFWYEILNTFETRKQANLAEEILHRELNVVKDSMSYNLCNAPMNFCRSGIIVSDETKKKISKANKGKKLSKETREKMSKAKRNMSDKTKKKISQSRKGIIFTEEHKNNLGKWQIGRKLTKEHKDNISKSHIGEVFSDERCKNISESLCGEKHPLHGKHHSEETKLKMSISHKNVKQKIVTCPHCGKEGKTNGMNRWHFNNCSKKLKELMDKFDVDIDHVLGHYESDTKKPGCPGIDMVKFRHDIIFINNGNSVIGPFSVKDVLKKYIIGD